jgi:hypothetical protein
MRHTRNNTSNNGGLAAAAPASSSSATAAAAAAAHLASSHLVSVHNQHKAFTGIDRNSREQALPLGAFPPARGNAVFVRHSAGDVTAAVAVTLKPLAQEGGKGKQGGRQVQLHGEGT